MNIKKLIANFTIKRLIMNFTQYLKFVPWVIIALLIILNQFGCIGKKITKEVTVVQRDTIEKIRYDSFMVEIPVPVEKKVVVKVTEKFNLDSIEQVYTDRINYLQKSIVTYRNAIAAFKGEKPPEDIVFTTNEYLDTFTTETYELGINIGIIGHVESFDYFLNQFEKKPKCPDCPKIKNNFISLSMETGLRRNPEFKVGYGHKWAFGKVGYTHLEPVTIDNFSLELGALFRF